MLDAVQAGCWHPPSAGHPRPPARPRPPAEAAALQVPGSSLRQPIFVGHGSVDQLIPPVIATTTQEVLEGLGCTSVEFHM